jgi:hypothetical protein
MKPEPVPRGIMNTLRVHRSITCSLVAMYTTEDLALSNSAMVARSSGSRSPRGVTVRGCAAASGSPRSSHGNAAQAASHEQHGNPDPVQGAPEQLLRRSVAHRHLRCESRHLGWAKTGAALCVILRAHTGQSAARPRAAGAQW